MCKIDGLPHTTRLNGNRHKDLFYVPEIIVMKIYRTSFWHSRMITVALSSQMTRKATLRRYNTARTSKH